MFARSIKLKKDHFLKFLIVFLIGTIGSGYFILREIKLHHSKNLVEKCKDKQDCEGRISALERLVKARKSLKTFNLQNANLENANLESANLSSTNLFNANLIRDHLQFAHISTANLEKANLVDSNLTNAYLSSANLHHANLYRANLHRAHLYNTDLSSTYLYRANLSRTYLYRANLANANLQSANLDNAYLIEAQNLTPSQIKSACYWENAIYKGVWDVSQFRWVVDDTVNQQYIKQLKEDETSDPKEAVDCNFWDIKD